MSYTDHCNHFSFNSHHPSKFTCFTSSCIGKKSLCSRKYDGEGAMQTTAKLQNLNKYLRSDCLHSDSAISDVTVDRDIE